MFKILIKELISLNQYDKFLFALAPYLVIIASMLGFAVLPWGKGIQVIDFNIGIFFLVAVSSIGVLGILLAGWSSNNKFTLIGASVQEPDDKLRALNRLVGNHDGGFCRLDVNHRYRESAAGSLVHLLGTHTRQLSHSSSTS